MLISIVQSIWEALPINLTQHTCHIKYEVSFNWTQWVFKQHFFKVLKIKKFLFLHNTIKHIYFLMSYLEKACPILSNSKYHGL